MSAYDNDKISIGAWQYVTPEQLNWLQGFRGSIIPKQVPRPFITVTEKGSVRFEWDYTASGIMPKMKLFLISRLGIVEMPGGEFISLQFPGDALYFTDIVMKAWELLKIKYPHLTEAQDLEAAPDA